MKAYAERFHAKPGWMFLTGSKENVDFALKKLGFRTEQRENHLNLFIMGNDPTGLWKKVLGVGDSKQIVESLESILRDQK